MIIYMYTIIIQKYDILHIQAVISSGMNLVGVQYLVIMKLGVAIYNYTISEWNSMVSMKMLIKIVCNQRMDYQNAFFQRCDNGVHNFTKDWHSILKVAKNNSCLAVLSPIKF